MKRGGPTELGAKTEHGTRRSRALVIPGALLDVQSVLFRVDPEKADLYNSRADECVQDILKYHVKPKLGCTLENVVPGGTSILAVAAAIKQLKGISEITENVIRFKAFF